MLKSVCVIFSLLFVVQLASAEVFKCTGKYGEALFQNFPCQFESVGWIPTDGQVSKKSPASPTESRLGTGAKKAPALPAEPRVGMSTEEVKAIWGEPTDTVQEEPQKGGRFEVWSYGATRSVRIDRGGRVIAIQQ